MAPGRPVRRGLRRRRPRAQAPRAAARARHRPVDGRRSCRAGEPVAEVRARARRRRPRHPAARRRATAARWAGCPSARLPASACATELRSPAEPIVELDDILRDALSDLLAARVPVRRRWSTPTGRVAGVLSIEAHLARDRPRAAPSGDPRPPPSWPRSGDVIAADPRPAATTSSATARAASRAASRDNGFCPRLDRRQLRPLLDAVRSSTSASRSSRWRSASRSRSALALLAHRRRWLVGADHRLHRHRSTRSRASSPFFLLLPITGRGNDDRDDRARRLHAADHLPQRHRPGSQACPPRRVDAARGMGLTRRQLLWRVELPLALPEILAGLRIAATTTVGLAALAFFAGAGGLGAADLRRHRLPVQRRRRRAGWCVLLAAALDLLVLGVQRALTPWQRAAAR